MASSSSLKVWKPLHVEVTWDDPRSSFDSFTLEDVIRGKGCGLQHDRKTVGYLCYVDDQYIEVYSDFDERDGEVGGGTAILNVLIKKIKMSTKGVIFKR